MQNRGLVKWAAIILAVICAYYLSFTAVSAHYSQRARDYAQGDVNREIRYLDSLALEKVWLGYTLQDVREKQIGLGLDLKGGMTVVLELDASDVLETLAFKKDDPTYRAALAEARKKQDASQRDFVSLFVDEFRAIDPGARLSTIFADPINLRGKITNSTPDDEVIRYLREEIRSAIDSSHRVLRTRIDRFGVVAPNIQKLEGSDRILVELPGVTEPERVRNLLQGSANLEFWECYLLPEVYQYLESANSLLASLGKVQAETATTVVESEAVDADEVTEEVFAEVTEEQGALDALAERAVAAEDNSTALAAVQPSAMELQNPLFSKLSPNVMQGQLSPSPVVGYAHSSDLAAIDSMLNLPRVKELLPRNLELKWSVKEIEQGSGIYQLFALKSTRRDGGPALSGDVVVDAESVIQNQQGRQDPGVSMTMNSEGAREWARITKENINRPIAIVLDDVVYSAPNVMNEIVNGVSSITGNFTIDEANDLANTLNSGRMAASVRIVQEDVVGPSLGQEAIKAGLISFIVALVLLMLYMCMMYGWKQGLVVDFALLLNLFFTLGILASLHAVLTLPSIAGMVLTLAMAVDANVLIFERIKEELKQGKQMLQAIEAGYQNAFSAIIDANVTSILTGFILYYFGSGAIRGFATTLIIGLVVSFLTAVFITRIIFEARARKGKMEGVTFDTKISRGFLDNTKFNFIGNGKKGIGGALIFLALGAVGLGIFGLNAGIDFTGGRNFVVKFDQPVSTAEVTSLLSDKLEGQVNVITITSAEQVRISTNYKVSENTPEVDAEIINLIYEGVQSLLPQGTTFEQFENDYVVSSQKVGASMASDITRGALIAVILSMFVMAIYILIRFRDVAFSVGVLASVAFTVMAIIAVYALLWQVMPFSMEIDQTFVAAVLAIIGYSMNDTIVVFDRVRESLRIAPNRNRHELFNYSLNSTLSRTFNTGVSTLLVIIIILFFGGASIRSFTFAMFIGVIAGTYSTLFIASPIAYYINNKKYLKSSQEEKK